MTPLFAYSNLETDSYNSELDQSNTECDSCKECENECENDKDMEGMAKST